MPSDRVQGVSIRDLPEAVVYGALVVLGGPFLVLLIEMEISAIFGASVDLALASGLALLLFFIVSILAVAIRAIWDLVRAGEAQRGRCGAPKATGQEGDTLSSRRSRSPKGEED